ncbi:protein bangles and beads [Eurosta solidaginis]|uniref:protein bangles and beads n=1 Tax=Eurosta solidaginis TaxID=178769 RepID=UPI003530A6FD
MKIQLVIISALLVSAYTLPVPDEEVSPVVQAAPQIQQKNTELQKTEEKVIDAIKPAEPRAAETPNAPAKEIKEEKLPAELPLNAPDAELPQSLPLPAAAVEKKEEKKDKQTRAEDNKVEEAKALPVATAGAVFPAGAAGIAEEPQIAAEEAKLLIDAAAVAVEEPASIAGKSTIIAEAAPAEQKREELTAAEETPILKTETKPATELSADAAPAPAPLAAAPAPIATDALKKDETPARQERVGEAVNEVDAKVGHVVSAAPIAGGAVVAGDDVVVPLVKSLPTEESVPAAVAAPFVEAAKEHNLKSAIPEHHHAPAKAEALAQAPAGDISQQASDESSVAKSLKPEETPAAPEAKKAEELAASVPAAASAALPELPKAQQKEIKPELKESEAAKISEEKKPAVAPEAEIKKPIAAKDTDSSDSSESKESNESNEDKST